MFAVVLVKHRRVRKPVGCYWYSEECRWGTGNLKCYILTVYIYYLVQKEHDFFNNVNGNSKRNYVSSLFMQVVLTCSL